MSQADKILKIDPNAPDEGSPTCITEGCGKERKWKGLCQSCYGQAKQLMQKHNLQWDDLERMGLIIADDKPFVALFKRKLAEVQRAAEDKSNQREEEESQET